VGERTVGALSLVIWLYLALGHGRFWRTSITLPRGADPEHWPSVVAVVPARDEAGVLPRTLPTLVAQRYPGSFRVVVIDDDSSDGTGELAVAAGAEVVRGNGPPPGWAGKVAAMAHGVARAGEPDYLLLTDADIAYPPDAVTALVRAATANRLDLTSQMVRLRAESFWERLIVPAFVYFFAQLYPFARVNGRGRTAAAAGGCMLVRRAALEDAGGLAEIRGAVIDDVSLGRLLKRRGRIWLGLSSDIASVRPYPHLRELWDMVARSAYTQLRHSPLLLAGTVLGLLLTYVVPPAALVTGLGLGDGVLATLGGLAWAIMAATYLPMLRFYRLVPWRALLLPAVAVLYTAMTVDSARRHRAGRGAAWKGRIASRHG
jgi:hopene-associated glycosyltransferase HpnB